MTDAPRLTPTQIAALRVTFALAWEGKPKPKGSQADFAREQAKAALALIEANGGKS